jgi:hypothetical protein
MRARISLLSLVLAFAVAASWAQGAADERVIDLAGGGRVVVRVDGSMGHYDSAGNPVTMREGEVMVAADGTRIMMKADALWRQIVEQATLNFARAVSPPWTQRTPDERSIELKDGGRIVVRADGTMAHYDAAGIRLRMDDGHVMTAKDGTKILMNNGALWTPNGERPATRPGG